MKAKITTKNEFFQPIRKEFNFAMGALVDTINPQELEKIKAVLPEEVRGAF